MVHKLMQLQSEISSMEFLFLYEDEDQCFDALFQWH